MLCRCAQAQRKVFGYSAKSRCPRKCLGVVLSLIMKNRNVSVEDQLHGVIGLTRIIGTGREIVPLREEEIAFMQGIGGENQVVEMSEGVIEQSRVRITSGPLVGMEGLIRKIDRHKRKAWLEVPMFGSVQTVQVGVEIVAKV